MSQANPSVQNGKSSKHPSHSSGTAKGFFTILVLCLIAVGGVAVTTFREAGEPSVIIEDTPSTTAVITTKAAPAAATTAKPTTTTASAPQTTTTAAPLYVLPLSDTVLVPFSEQPIYSETMQEYRAHKAVDFAGEEGETVFSFANGIVASVTDDALYGGTVTIDHGVGVMSVYSGIEPSVKKGDELKTGDIVGTLSVIPCEITLGPHLHLELTKDGKAVDPTIFLNH